MVHVTVFPISTDITRLTHDTNARGCLCMPGNVQLAKTALYTHTHTFGTVHNFSWGRGCALSGMHY